MNDPVATLPAVGCVEYLKLEHDYASAVHRWAQYDSLKT